MQSIASALYQDLYLIKEHVGMFKAANNYDILDPQSGQIILECREPNLGPFTKMLRFTDYKRMTPFDLNIQTPEGETVLSVKRGVSIVLSKVDVVDAQGTRLGGFQQKLFSIGGKFDVLDSGDMPLCTLQGKWTGWEFKFQKDGVEMAKVSKKWSGLGKEFFTSADNYMLQIAPTVAKDDPMRPLIIAAVMCIDMVLKE